MPVESFNINNSKGTSDFLFINLSWFIISLRLCVRFKIAIFTNSHKKYFAFVVFENLLAGMYEWVDAISISDSILLENEWLYFLRARPSGINLNLNYQLINCTHKIYVPHHGTNGSKETITINCSIIIIRVFNVTTFTVPFLNS